MSLPVVVAAALFVGLVAYALFGGADFGSGYFDLTAGSARAGAELRTQVDHSIGPVWEANHVWLIYVLVIWWTGFPESFAAAMTTLILQMLLALLGIVLRGAAFAFRKYAGTLEQARVFLAGVFLVADADRAHHPRLAAALRRRTLVVGVVTGLVVFAGLVPLHRDAPTLWAGLTGRALPLVLMSAVAGTATLALLWRRRYRLARVTAVLAVATVISGWGVGQYPWLLVDEVTISDAAGATATLWGLLVVVALAGVIVLPALAYLFWLTQSERWTSHDTQSGKPVGPRSDTDPARR